MPQQITQYLRRAGNRLFVGALVLICIAVTLALPRESRADPFTFVTVNSQNLRSSDLNVPPQVLSKKIQALAEVIKGSGYNGQVPDVIFLQEVKDLRALELFKDELGEEGAGHSIYYFPPEGGEPFSVATISGLPLASSSRAVLLGTGALTRRALQLKFRLSPTLEIDTLNVHLPSPRHTYEVRRELLLDLASKVSSNDKFLIAGDFNLTPPEFLRFLRECGDCKSWNVPHFEGNLGEPGTFFDRVNRVWSFFDTMVVGDAFRPRISSSNEGALALSEIKVITEGKGQLDSVGVPQRFIYETSQGVSDHLPFRIGINASRSESETTPERSFPRLPQLLGVPLSEYTRKNVFPVFLLKRNLAVYISEDISLQFLEELSEERRYDHYSQLKIPNILSEYQVALQGLRESILRIDLPKFKILPGPDGAPLSMLSGWRQAGLAQAALFHLKYGVEFEAPWNSELKIILLPISAHNLRAFSKKEKGTLQDLTYRQFCRRLDSLSEGISSAWLSLLLGNSIVSGKTDDILADALGIYIAEEYKRAALGLSSHERPWMSGRSISHTLLLQDYFLKGGKIPVTDTHSRRLFERSCGVPSRYPEWEQGTCWYFQSSYRDRMCERISLETILSTYYEANYDVTSLRGALECEGRNFFECLYQAASRPETNKELAFDEFQLFLTRIADEAGKVEFFIRSLEFPLGIMSSGCYI